MVDKKQIEQWVQQGTITQDQANKILTESSTEKTVNLSLAELVIRKLLGVILVLSVIPPLINPIILILVIPCLIYAVHMLIGKNYNLVLNFFAFIIGCLLYIFSVFKSFKLILFYTPSNNNDFIGFFLFNPFIIVLFISALFMLIHNILYFNKRYSVSPSRGKISLLIVFVIIIGAILLPLSKNLEAKTGQIRGTNPNGSKQNVVITYDSNRWLYVFKRTNENDKPISIEKIFGNKEEINFNDSRLGIVDVSIIEGRLVIDPLKTAVITIQSPTPLYTATFVIENQLADSFVFVK